MQQGNDAELIQQTLKDDINSFGQENQCL